MKDATPGIASDLVKCATRNIARARHWLARRRLERELTHYRRLGDNLATQIVNDVRALVYVRRRQILVSSKLKEFRT